MKFSEAYKLPIGEHVEKKGKFSYLSWCYAVRFLRENFPESTWTIHENADGLPIFSIGQSHLVKITVHHDGKDFTQFHPILNGANKPVAEPNTFDINTSIQRGLTKAIGIATGIGLGLYAGEDLPKEEGEEKPKNDHQAVIEKLCAWIDGYFAKAEEKGFTVETLEKWYSAQADVVKLKQSLDADSLSKVNGYYAQVKGAMADSQRKAA